jgi:orotate phosphoribosyltransferase
MKNIEHSEDTIKILKEYNALLHGHFVLSSGLHSEYYVQCAQIFSQPQIATKLCKELIYKISKSVNLDEINMIVSPAIGGILIGYEIARQLNKETIFCERSNGHFTFRRDFHLNKNHKILVIEDVITTGKSSLETYEAIKPYGAKIIAEACLIKRDPKITEINNVPIISLIDIKIPVYDAESLPESLQKIPITKPGSRFLKN